jgi:hypothetical protein
MTDDEEIRVRVYNSDDEILNAFLEMIQRKGWETFNSVDGTAWFGGKSHSTLLQYIPEEDGNLEDYDFLVVGWAKSVTSNND